MKIKNLFLLLSISVILVNCASTPKGRTIELKGLSIIESPPGIKVSITKKNGQLERVCAPREADFAETQSSGGSLSLPGTVPTTDESINEKSGQGALALGGRDSAVLILREMTYRACELALNTNADEKESLAIYIQFLKIAQQMIATQQNKGTSVIGLKADSNSNSD